MKILNVSIKIPVALCGLLITLPAFTAADDFHRNVAPILRQYCAGCHNDNDRDGDFSVETYRSLIKGGDSGSGIEPGNPASSLLMQQIKGEEEPSMPPPKEPQLSPQQIATLNAWIKAGAKGPKNDSSILTTLNISKTPPAAGIAQPVTALAVSPTGNHAVGRYGVVQTDQQKFADHPGKVNGLAFSPDGNQLAVASGVTGLRGTATLWNVADGRRLLDVGEGHRDTLYGIAFSPDGKTLATAGYDRLIQLWNVADGKLIRTFEGHNGAVYDIAFSPDGSVIASASGDSSVKLWNVASGQRLDTFGQPTGEQFNVAFTPDGQHVVAAGADKAIRLWKWVSKEKPQVNPMVLVRFAHEQEITDLVIHPQGTMLASASADRTVTVWSLPELKILQTFPDQSDVVSALAFAPAGDSLWVGRMDGSQDALKLALASAQSTVAQPGRQPTTPIAEAEPNVSVEVEPNDVAGTANAIELPAQITGVIHNEQGSDADLFRFTSRAGQQWVVEINAARSKSPLDSKVEVLDAEGKPIERVRLQAVRDSWLTFRGKNSSTSDDFRLFKWREMTLNQFLYLNGEVVKLWHYPRGPDSGYMVYPGAGNRHGYFDTTPLAHPMGQPAYVVRALPAGSTTPPNGLPTFPIYYENDDDSHRRLGSDSKLTFTAPSDGQYIVRVSDVRGDHGPKHNYTLNVRPRQPDFAVTLGGFSGGVPSGSGREFSVTAQRMDNYDGDIRVDISDVPPGYRVTTPLIIEAGQRVAYGAVTRMDAVAPQSERQVIDPPIRNLTYKFYHGTWTAIPDFSQLDPVKSGELPLGMVHLDSRDRDDHFGFQFEGQIEITEEGEYEFILESDDGSALYIDGNKVVDNDGAHGTIRKTGQVKLAAGQHAIRVDYFEGAREQTLYVAWQGPGFKETSLCKDRRNLTTVTATAMIDGRQVSHDVNSLAGFTPMENPKLRVKVTADKQNPSQPTSTDQPLELTIAPGETISAHVSIERNGLNGRVSFGSHDSGRNLPHGIYVDNIGLNGLLIVAGQNEREFFITADPWVPETTRLFHLRAAAEGGITSYPILLHVRKK
ncbi:MAG: PA14 domain-containing protein [Mariniblastus sp.]|nr:PA14 domain-containing protein [Mariniblastus sp.]